MTTRIQIRRGTAASWAAVNPVLSPGELGLETDTFKLKVGTGLLAWNSLGYFPVAWSAVTDKPTYVAAGSSQAAARAEIGAAAAADRGVANGYASLDSSGLVPSAQLPSYVDDVLALTNLAGFPGTGESGKIYVANDTNKTYRWTGSAYVEISPSPGTTDSLTEGSTNLYYTNARADNRIANAVGVSVQAYDADLTAFAGKTAPTGAVVGTTDTQTLTSKTLTSPVMQEIKASANNARVLFLDGPANAVNSFQINNAAAGGSPVLYATGSDTNINIALFPKGTGGVLVNDPSGQALAQFLAPQTGTPANYAYTRAGAAGASAIFGVWGSDTNVNLELAPKNAGVVTASGVPVVTTTGTQTLSAKTLTNPTLDGYTEGVLAVGTVAGTHTLNIAADTVITATLTASTPCTFTMPTAAAGKAFTLMLRQAASGPTTATFTGVKWANGGTAPVMTATASRMDIFTFFSDGTNWYGSAAQNYIP